MDSLRTCGDIASLTAIRTENENESSVVVRSGDVTEDPQPYGPRDTNNEAKLIEDHVSFYKSTVFKAFAMISCYLIVGVVGFHFCVEKWSIRDALYFSIVSFTTVGYGDISPKSDAGKLFNCFFAVMGIIIIGISLGYIGQHFVQIQLNALSKQQENDEFHDEGPLEAKKPSGILTFLYAILPTLLTIIIGSVVFGLIEGWSWIDSLYWCIITTSTVGYGDLSPSGSASRWVAIFFIPVGVSVVSATIGNVANIFVKAEMEKAHKTFLGREVTLRHLEQMDIDGDGEVSMLEFVEHMLLAMDKVDQTMLNELHAQFNRLDVDGSGGLQKNDIEIYREEAIYRKKYPIHK